MIQIPLCWLLLSMPEFIFSAPCGKVCALLIVCVHLGLHFILPKLPKSVVAWPRVLWPTFSLSHSPGKCLFPQWITFPIQVKTFAGRHAYWSQTLSVFATALLCWKVISQILCRHLVVVTLNWKFNFLSNNFHEYLSSYVKKQNHVCFYIKM